MPISISLMLVFGIATYFQVRHFREKYGVLPWNGSPRVWGAVVGLAWWILLIPVVILVITERSARRRAQAIPPVHLAGVTRGGAMPLGIREAPFDYAPVDASTAVASTTMPAVSAPALPPSWAPDPSGRHQYRWWDGRSWTSSVLTRGVTTTEQA